MDKRPRKGKTMVPHSIFYIGSKESGDEAEEFDPLYSITPVADDDGNIKESKEDFKKRLLKTLSQMMFVSGEQAEPSAETTYLIEEIVREQVIEMVSEILRLKQFHC